MPAALHQRLWDVMRESAWSVVTHLHPSLGLRKGLSPAAFAVSSGP